jgi:hypothetical protein
MLRVPLVASPGRVDYWLDFLVALVVVAVAHRRLDAVSLLPLGRSLGLGCPH